MRFNLECKKNYANSTLHWNEHELKILTRSQIFFPNVCINVCRRLLLPVTVRHIQLISAVPLRAQKPTLCQCFRTKKLANSHLSVQVLDNGWYLHFYIKSIQPTYNLTYTHCFTLWYVCVCWSKLVSKTKNSLATSVLCLRVSSFKSVSRKVLFLSDAFPSGAEIPSYFPCSKFAVTQLMSHPDEAILDTIAISIFGVKILSIAVKIAFWILTLTSSTTLCISLVILSIGFLSNVWTNTEISLAAAELSLLLTTIHQSTRGLSKKEVLSLNIRCLNKKTSCSKSLTSLKTLLLCCFFFQVETMFVLTSDLHLF